MLIAQKRKRGFWGWSAWLVSTDAKQKSLGDVRNAFSINFMGYLLVEESWNRNKRFSRLLRFVLPWKIMRYLILFILSRYSFNLNLRLNSIILFVPVHASAPEEGSKINWWKRRLMVEGMVRRHFSSQICWNRLEISGEINLCKPSKWAFDWKAGKVLFEAYCSGRIHA